MINILVTRKLLLTGFSIGEQFAQQEKPGVGLGGIIIKERKEDD